MFSDWLLPRQPKGEGVEYISYFFNVNFLLNTNGIKDAGNYTENE